MVILKKQDILKMPLKEIEDKISELKMELMRNKVLSGKGEKLKIKEIRKTIARLLTFSRLNPIDKKEK